VLLSDILLFRSDNSGSDETVDYLTHHRSTCCSERRNGIISCSNTALLLPLPRVPVSKSLPFAARMSAVIEDQIISPWSVPSSLRYQPNSNKIPRSDTHSKADPVLLPRGFGPAVERYRQQARCKSCERFPSSPALCTRRRR
jgi:hypothetical protein